MQYPVPPLPQQHRIVAAIETHFSRLDAAVASLTRAKANVKRARASVLKAAVEGRLVPTEAELARAEGRDYESASTLLARILAERKAAWTASGAKGKYKEPVAPDLRRLAVLPAGWCWTTLDAAAPLQPGFAFPSSRFQSTGIRLVKGINVRDGWMSEESVDFWPASDVDHLHRYWLRTEDVVLAMDRPVYSSGSKSTKVAMLDRRWDRSLLLQRVGCFRRATGLAPRYLFAFLRADSFRMHLI